MPRAKHPRDILGPGGAIAETLEGYEAREQQLQMADEVAYAIDNNTHAVIEAGTGTGKSLAYLVPALLSGKRAIVSTGDKALQAQLIDKDIPFLHEVMPTPFKDALLKGRSNYLCIYNHNLASSMGTTTIPAEFDLWSTTTIDGDLDKYNGEMTGELRASVSIDSDSCLNDHCPHYTDCWAEKAKDRAKSANVVVINHALLMADLSLRAKSDGHASVLPSTEVHIIDEAHHLEDSATDAFGVDSTLNRWNGISRTLARAAQRYSRNAAELWNDQLSSVSSEVIPVFQTIQKRLVDNKKTSDNMGDETLLAKSALVAVHSMATKMRNWTPGDMDKTARASWSKLCDRIDNFAHDLSIVTTPTADEGWIRYASLEGFGRNARVVLSAKPVNIAPILRRLLFSDECGWTVVATSATLATGKNINYWRGRVGLDKANELIVGSPFDYPNNALIYLPVDGELFDSSLYRDGGMSGYFDRMAAEVYKLVTASKGRAFVLFTSNNGLNEVYNRLLPKLNKYLVLKQGESPRPELVRQFKEDGHAILFGVKSFWEGVDIAGECLSMVIIDKFPFPPPDDPVWAAKCNTMNIQQNDKWAWFRGLAIPTVTLTMKQGAGRLIRSKQDRGVIAILDGRATTKPYGSQIIHALPPMSVTRDIDVVKTFFA